MTGSTSSTVNETPDAAETTAAPRLSSVTLTAIGAEGLENVAENDSISFYWSRGPKFFLSEPSAAFPDGAVYWDSVSVQTCRLHRDKKKYIKLFVQKVPVGQDNMPTDYGQTVGAGYLDLGKYAAHDECVEEDVVVWLKPRGRLTLNVQLDPIDTIDGNNGELDEAISADVSSSSQCVTPTVSVDLLDETEEEAAEAVLSAEGGDGDEGRDATVAERHNVMSPSITVSSCTTSTVSCADNDRSSSRSLESKLRRVTRQCEEARARAFSEASVALQRGIEIDNLKRAKDILMKRLETAEQQLMAMMKQELAMTIQETDKSSATLLGMSDIILQLAETKVALAEKEFEVMEMQGKLKGRDAHIQALLLHLDAVKESSLMTAKSSSIVLRKEVEEAREKEADATREDDERDVTDDEKHAVVHEPEPDELELATADRDCDHDVKATDETTAVHIHVSAA